MRTRHGPCRTPAAPAGPLRRAAGPRQSFLSIDPGSRQSFLSTDTGSLSPTPGHGPRSRAGPASHMPARLQRSGLSGQGVRGRGRRISPAPPGNLDLVSSLKFPPCIVYRPDAVGRFATPVNHPHLEQVADLIEVISRRAVDYYEFQVFSGHNLSLR